MEQVYDGLAKVSGNRINLYKSDAQKAVKRLNVEKTVVQRDVDKFQARLEGKIEYIPLASVQNDEDAVKKRKRIRESDKGLKYRLAEATDEARILGHQYRNGLIALGKYRTQIASIDAEVEQLEESEDPSAAAKTANLQSERADTLREKEALEIEQREYERELKHYEGKIDRIQAKISFYDYLTRKGNSKLRRIENGLDILDDYIRERDDLKSVHELLNSLNGLDESQERINKAIERYDAIVGEELDRLSDVVDNDIEYSTRPLMQQVEGLSKEEQVATQKDMGRILGKLGIPI